MYIYLSSKSSKDFYPHNNAVDFGNHLSEVILQEGKWLVGLTDMYLPPLRSGSEIVTVMSSLVQPSFIQGTKLPVLRRVLATSDDNGTWYNFSKVAYFPVQSRHIQDIQIYIRLDEEASPAFSEGTVYCALHFIKIS